MSLRSRLDLLERLWARPVGEMNDTELCRVIALGTGPTPAAVLRLPEERLRAVAMSELAESLAQDLGLTRERFEALTPDELRALTEAEQ
jgi:hypothetical protein